MTWTYGGDPSANDKDAVRFLSGDTDTTDQLVTDEEIAWLLTENPNVYSAAAESCRAIASKYARYADKTVGRISESASQKADAYEARADSLDEKASMNCVPSFGGLSISEKEALDEDTDAVQPSFPIGDWDHPEVPSEREYMPYKRYKE